VQRLNEEIALAEAACAWDLTQQSQNRLLALKAALNKVNSGARRGGPRGWNIDLGVR
jgi:hypothetical protein